MNPRIISALILRYIYLYTRTPMRLVELVFWPMVDLLIWGFTMTYVQTHVPPELRDKLSFFVGGCILWDVTFRAQQGVAVSFLEDVWTRNLLNIFVAPVRTAEYLCATFGVGLMRIGVTTVIMSAVAAGLYAFNIFSLGWALIPFATNLLFTGWALGMISTALILRWGQAAESLAWAIPFFIQPFSAVFYSVESMQPVWVQSIVNCLPTTHVFEGMRDVIDGKGFSQAHFFWALGLNVIFMAIAGWIFLAMLNVTKKKGLLTKFATQ
jgi:ABC-2 type transport system permease protein